MSTQRMKFGACFLALALAGASFGLPARSMADEDPLPEIEINDQGERFIFLDDGSEDISQTTPGTGLFSDRERGDGPGTGLGLSAGSGSVPGTGQATAGVGSETRKQSFFILNDTTRGLYAPLLRLDSVSINRPQTGIQLGYGHMEPESTTPSGFGIWLSSEMTAQNIDRFAMPSEMQLSSGFDQRSYNVALGVGYSGFALGASLRHEYNAFDRSYRGFDLGLAYQGRSWFTNVEYAGYQNDRGPLFHSFLGDQKTQAFEVGAGYAVWPGLTFSGRFKFFDYSNPLYPNTAPDQEHVFSLGTRLNF